MEHALNYLPPLFFTLPAPVFNIHGSNHQGEWITVVECAAIDLSAHCANTIQNNLNQSLALGEGTQKFTILKRYLPPVLRLENRSSGEELDN